MGAPSTSAVAAIVLRREVSALSDDFSGQFHLGAVKWAAQEL